MTETLSALPLHDADVAVLKQDNDRLSAPFADPFAPRLQQDPWPGLKYLRDERPIFHTDDRPLFFVTRYEDCARIYEDNVTFSSTAYDGLQGPGWLQKLPPVFEEMLDARESRADLRGLIKTRFVFGLDGEAHQRLRRLVQTAFLPNRITYLEGEVQSLIADLLAPMRNGAGEVEVITQIADALPTNVIAMVTGVDRVHAPSFARWANNITDNPGLGFREPTVEHMQYYLDNLVEVAELLTDQIERCRSDPGDNLFSALIRAKDGDSTLTDLEIIAFIQNLLVGGFETTSALISSGAKSLLEHPDQMRMLRENPSLMSGFLDEVLRYDSPLTSFRVATRDVTVRDVLIPAGSVITLVTKAAGRDERQFHDPDRFDITRSPNSHLAFGKGVHFCPGRQLARYEASKMFEQLIPELDNYEIAAAEWTPNALMRKMDRLVLRRKRT